VAQWRYVDRTLCAKLVHDGPAQGLVRYREHEGGEGVHA